MRRGASEVAATADDALLSKVSCTRLGYYSDKYVSVLAGATKRSVRRSPIINRGYWARVQAFDKTIVDFLGAQLSDDPSVNCRKQIVSLGAGMDSTFWRLRDSHSEILSANLGKFIEIDFLETCLRKIRILLSHKTLFFPGKSVAMAPTKKKETEALSAVSSVDSESKSDSMADGSSADCGLKASAEHSTAEVSVDLKRGALTDDSDVFAIVGGDLCEWSAVLKSLETCGLDQSAPTLLLSECVLIYIPTAASRRILQWATSSLTGGSAVVIYEQILPHDSFGKQMIRNLRQRGLSLPSFEDYPTLEAQCKRLEDAGYALRNALDFNQLFAKYLPPTEVSRIQRLELFDEFEEWFVFMAHYCVAFGANPGDELTEESLAAWAKLAFLSM